MKLNQLLDIYALHEDHTLAKYCVSKHKKLPIL